MSDSSGCECKSNITIHKEPSGQRDHYSDFVYLHLILIYPSIVI